MSKRSDGICPRRGYHHGNLKQALIDAGRQLIIEKGPNGFSLVEAAKIANVSPAAPYRHYPNRDALLVDIATKGYIRLEEILEKAWNQGGPEPLVALERTSDAYLSFAQKERAYYAAMFEAGLERTGDENLDKVAQSALGILQQIAETFHNQLPDAQDKPPVELIFTQIWALCHGMASLYGAHKGGTNASTANQMTTNEMLKSGLFALLSGLNRTK